MANEKMRDQDFETDPNKGTEQDKGKAMGAGATSGTQGQQRGKFETQNESPGQGGGIQGTGQRNPNPTQGQTGQGTKGSGFRDEESTSKRKPEHEEY
ncbi:MAG TPA: hypothetical protein VFH31_02025 [Pyrinomonadaceae bacterium]|nr:hypothetical protein [Pyrinomonadaceae bacterium]